MPANDNPGYTLDDYIDVGGGNLRDALEYWQRAAETEERLLATKDYGEDFKAFLRANIRCYRRVIDDLNRLLDPRYDLEQTRVEQQRLDELQRRIPDSFKRD